MTAELVTEQPLPRSKSEFNSCPECESMESMPDMDDSLYCTRCGCNFLPHQDDQALDK